MHRCGFHGKCKPADRNVDAVMEKSVLILQAHDTAAVPGIATRGHQITRTGNFNSRLKTLHWPTSTRKVRPLVVGCSLGHGADMNIHCQWFKTLEVRLFSGWCHRHRIFWLIFKGGRGGRDQSIIFMWLVWVGWFDKRVFSPSTAIKVLIDWLLPLVSCRLSSYLIAALHLHTVGMYIIT